MENMYLKSFIDDFVRFLIAQRETRLIITTKNKKILSGLKKYYDYIVLNQVLEFSDDIQSVLQQANQCLKPNGRIIIIYQNYLFAFFSGLLKSFFNRQEKQNWLSTTDLNTFFRLVDLEMVIQQPLCFLPFSIPIISILMNKFILYFFPFNHLSFLQYIIVRKHNLNIIDKSVSIIVPARNEKGNIRQLFHQLLPIGTDCEVIFVEGHSQDETNQEIRRYIKIFQNKLSIKFKLISQKQNIGKAAAVRQGFDAATKEVLMIYDADMSIQLPDLVKFYQAIISHQGDLINGCRLIYPMPPKAMQFLNILGNKIFCLIYSWILGQKIKDTLCGTKALWRHDYLRIKNDKALFGKYDPFGDFDLLIGASKLNRKIIDLPVRYFERTYGSTNIKRFQNAWQLAKYSLIAAKYLKLRMS